MPFHFLTHRPVTVRVLSTSLTCLTANQHSRRTHSGMWLNAPFPSRLFEVRPRPVRFLSPLAQAQALLYTCPSGCLSIPIPILISLFFYRDLWLFWLKYRCHPSSFPSSLPALRFPPRLFSSQCPHSVLTLMSNNNTIPSSTVQRTSGSLSVDTRVNVRPPSPTMP